MKTKKIYTFYHEINYPFQKNIIKLWKKNWEIKGFEAIILTPEDAKKSKDFKKIYSSIQYFHKEITGEIIQDYALSCFIRWIAYSTVNENDEPFFVSDYDLLNNSLCLNTHIPYDLTFYDNFCPCFASGTPAQFLSLINSIINYLDKNLPDIKEKFKKQDLKIFHDQSFFLLCDDYFYESVKINKLVDSRLIEMPKSFQKIESIDRHLIHLSNYCISCVNTENKKNLNNIEKKMIKLRIIEFLFFKIKLGKNKISDELLNCLKNFYKIKNTVN